MMRGDLVVVSLPGDYGKPRPALVIQSDLFAEHPSVTVLPITSHLVEAPLLRIAIGPESGLERISQVQIDKAQTPRRERIGAVIGRVDGATLAAVNRALAVFLGLA
ncbi:MAG TPA: type II toxin-antitoxin system PemK/MazF family toxin [Stellaceae bacterium]|jgi:mRNA interferase MazF|nr:type II toxin-antitoxin system PemK/MazF family toxin [Stellaceae bacterium]